MAQIFEDSEFKSTFYGHQDWKDIVRVIPPCQGGLLMKWARGVELHDAERTSANLIENPRLVLSSYEKSISPNLSEPSLSIRSQPPHSPEEIQYNINYEYNSEGRQTVCPEIFEMLNQHNVSMMSIPPQAIDFQDMILPPLSLEPPLGLDNNEMCERIWRFNSQRASIYLQNRLKEASSEEYQQLASAIMAHATKLMTHRFGNFLVQGLVQLASPQDLEQLVSMFYGKIVELSMDPFCCHVIQKILDVAPPSILQSISHELLSAVILTMTDSSGSHVWQKLLHLPCDPRLPTITLSVHQRIHLEAPDSGWLAVATTEAGCTTIKSFLAASYSGQERQDCLNELLDKLDQLIVQPHATNLVVRIALIGHSRVRALSQILSRASDLAIHPVASMVLIAIIHRRIHGFAHRLHNALVAFRNDLLENHYGQQVLRSLNAALPEVKRGNWPSKPANSKYDIAS